MAGLCRILGIGQVKGLYGVDEGESQFLGEVRR